MPQAQAPEHDPLQGKAGRADPRRDGEMPWPHGAGLKDSKLEKSQIDKIILVGGPTRMP